MMQTDKEYAEALFLLSMEEQQADEYADALQTVRQVTLENPAYIEFLSSPAIPLTERLSAVDEAFGADMPEHIVSFLKILCENGRIRSLIGCVEEFGKLVMAMRNRTVASVISAVPLDDRQKAALCEKLQTVTGKLVDAVYTVDQSLIGGIKIEVEGKTFDGSIKHRLYDVKDVIIG